MREDWAGLRSAMLALLEDQEVKVGDIALGRLAYPDSPVANHVAISQRVFGELTPVAEISRLEKGWFSAKRTVVLNADHPTIAHLLELGAREPELAAYLGLKLFYLRANERLAPEVVDSADNEYGLSPTRDAQLATAAAAARHQRGAR